MRAMSGRSRPVAKAFNGVRAASLLVLSLCGCDTLTSAYRDVIGTSKSDPPANSADAANIDQGSKSPYPNLASVPNTPVRGLTEAERAALADGLIADRTNAHYTETRLAAGDGGTVLPAPAPLPEDQTASSGAMPADAAKSGSSSPDQATPTSTTPGTTGSTDPGSGLAASVELAGGEHPTPSAPAPAASAAAPEPAQTGGGAELAGGTELAGGQSSGAELTGPGEAAPRETAPRETAPRETAPRETLRPQTIEPPPPPPKLAATPQIDSSDLAGGELAGGSGGAAATPEQVAAAPAPPQVPGAPELAPTPAVSSVPQPASPRAPASVIEVDFSPGSAEVPGAALDPLKTVPAIHQQHGGLVRVVSHAQIPTGGADAAGQALSSYQAALARAQAVKQVLIGDGMPAAKVIAEVSTKEPPSDRVDVMVEY